MQKVLIPILPADSSARAYSTALAEAVRQVPDEYAHAARIRSGAVEYWRPFTTQEKFELLYSTVANNPGAQGRDIMTMYMNLATADESPVDSATNS